MSSKYTEHLFAKMGVKFNSKNKKKNEEEINEIEINTHSNNKIIKIFNPLFDDEDELKINEEEIKIT